MFSKCNVIIKLEIKETQFTVLPGHSVAYVGEDNYTSNSHCVNRSLGC